jgi:purine/pyrimidine-nucleoside phosphorylase
MTMNTVAVSNAPVAPITPLIGQVDPKANLYFDGKCVSHTIQMVDGSKVSVGVIFPSQLVFNTQSREFMRIAEGQCHVKQAGESGWTLYKTGQEFEVPANSSFEIQVDAVLHYVCYFG